MTHTPLGRYYGYGIRSMRGRYTSYWNAFLLLKKMSQNRLVPPPFKARVCPPPTSFRQILDPPQVSQVQVFFYDSEIYCTAPVRHEPCRFGEFLYNIYQDRALCFPITFLCGLLLIFIRNKLTKCILINHEKSRNS